jgi:hypothetical protein
MRILGVVSSSSREVPNAPTIGTATDVGTGRAYNNGAATVTFTAPTFDGGLPITGYTVTSSPGGFTATGASSPLTVTGLQSSTAYTFTVVATNSRGNSAASAASNSITATTVPQAPTIGTATAGDASATVTYTANATGGKAVSTYTATSSPGSLTGTGSSPITVSGLTNGTAYTFTVTATNANGTSTASAASNSVTPATPSSYESIASYTFTAPTYGSSFTFSSIPQTYKHLQLRIFSANTTLQNNTMQSLLITGNNTRRSHWLRTTDGSTVAAGTDSLSCFIGQQPASISTQTTQPRSITIVDIHDYTSTTKYKTYRSISGYDSNGGTKGQEIGIYSGGFYGNTNAITSLIYNTDNDLTPGTVVALYGIKG